MSVGADDHTLDASNRHRGSFRNSVPLYSRSLMIAPHERYTTREGEGSKSHLRGSVSPVAARSVGEGMHSSLTLHHSLVR